MKQESAQSVLHRLLRSATEVAKEPVTSARALRLAMARSAERSVGLVLSVSSVTEEVMPLDTLLAQVDPEWMLVSIGLDAQLIGYAGLDLQTRTAVVEMQTLGEMRKAPAAERPITPSDAALCAPFVARFLSDFAVTSDSTPLSGWTEDLSAGARFADARAVGMVLPETEMRLVKLTLDLGGDDRQGMLVLALPVRRKPPTPVRTGPGPRFADQLRLNVMDAPSSLNAVLHRMRLPIARIERFEIGQVIALPGITVRSVTIEGPDGTPVAEGRLGQITGMRAVRIEKRGAAELGEMHIGQSHGRASAAPKTGLPNALEMAGQGMGMPDVAGMEMGGMMAAGDLMSPGSAGNDLGFMGADAPDPQFESGSLMAGAAASENANANDGGVDFEAMLGGDDEPESSADQAPGDETDGNEADGGFAAMPQIEIDMALDAEDSGDVENSGDVED